MDHIQLTQYWKNRGFLEHSNDLFASNKKPFIE
jgi:hypothetical protein